MGQLRLYSAVAESFHRTVGKKQAQKCISAQLLVFKWTGGNG